MALTPEEKIELQENVLKEIKNVGDNVKAQNDELQTNYHELKTTFESGRKSGDDKIEKLQQDIATRQDEMDKKFAEAQSKYDEIELSLKRPGFVHGTNQPLADEKEVKDFYHSTISNRKEGKVGRFDMKGFNYDAEAYIAYKNAFTDMLHFGDEAKRGVTPEEIKALSVGIDTDGGYVVPPEMSSRIIKRIYEMDPIRQLANVENISSDALEMGSDWDEFSAGWVNETGNRTESDTAKLGKEKIFVHEMFAKPKATQQLLEDASVNIENWIAEKVAKRFARIEGASFVTGDGNEKPTGFLTYDNWTTAGTLEKGKVEQINMGAAAALTADGFVNVKYSMLEDYLERGTWLMNRSTVADAMLLKDGAGNYIWKPSMLAADPSSTILGAPVRMATTMPAIAAGALSVAYADWREAYTIVDRIGISVLRDPYTDKPHVQFYTRKRVGGKVVNWQAIKLGVIAA